MVDRSLPPGAHSAGTIGEFQASDGRILRYREVAAHGPARHHLLYCHGIESHGTWFLPAAEALAQNGCTVWLIDRRGSGLNRESQPGHAPSAKVLLADLASFCRARGEPPTWIVGLSWGGKLATAAAAMNVIAHRGLILITPGLAARVDLTRFQKLRLAGSLAVGGRTPIPIPIEASMFTDDPTYLRFIHQDPLRLRAATARFFWCSVQLDRCIRRYISAMRCPTLLFLAGKDRIIDNEGVRRVLGAASAQPLTIVEYPDAIHAVQWEQRQSLTQTMLEFMDAAGERC